MKPTDQELAAQHVHAVVTFLCLLSCAVLVLGGAMVAYQKARADVRAAAAQGRIADALEEISEHTKVTESWSAEEDYPKMKIEPSRYTPKPLPTLGGTSADLEEISNQVAKETDAKFSQEEKNLTQAEQLFVERGRRAVTEMKLNSCRSECRQ